MSVDATRIAVVLKGYPRLSETFIAQELLALEQRGVRLTLVSLRYPTDKLRHPVHDAIQAPVAYLPEYLRDEPCRVLRGGLRCLRHAGFWRSAAVFLGDLIRDRTRNRIRRFGQALVMAAELAPDVSHVYAHFLHTPTSVARYACMVRGLDFSVSAHAKDIWTTPVWELREKLADCRFAVTCTAHNVDYLRGLTASPERVRLMYHGLDLTRFDSPAPRPPAALDNDGRDPRRPIVILSVGRLVEKKGYDVLLEALARLPTRLCWRFEHVGGGALRACLDEQARRLGIDQRIRFHGPLAQGRILDLYREADLFVLASRIAADGDRDGMPNVLMEAQSQRLACISTRVSAIPELIDDARSGLLVDPDDVDALSAALRRLIESPALRARLAVAGERRVRESFDLDANVGQLVASLTEILSATGTGTPAPRTSRHDLPSVSSE